MRERGLKSIVVVDCRWSCSVAPHAGAWIEITRNTVVSRWWSSLPMRERGLKLCRRGQGEAAHRSLPMRERGLKFVIDVHHEQVAEVAPHAGAWIEISRWQTNERRSDGSLPMRECICLMVCVPVYRGCVGRVIGEKLTM